MAYNLITNSLRLQVANQFVESFSEAANNIYYVFVSKNTDFSDSTVPTPTDNVRTTLYRAYKDMIYGRQVSPADIKLAIERKEWASGTIYDQYEHDVDMTGKNFYVATLGSADGYDIFKCLSNNKGAQSTYYPRLSETSAADEIYETVDGYQWKYMYSIPINDWNKFVTTDFMPLIPNSNVTSNAINGSIDFVEVTFGGSGYNMYTEGLVQSVTTIGTDQFITIEATSSPVTDFYKNCSIKIGNELKVVAEYIVTGSLRRVKVDSPFTTTPTSSDRYYISPSIQVSGACCGDGTGFKARALINASSSNSIYKVEVLNRGNNYTFANLVAVGGIITVSNTAVFKAMISPQGGHGSDIAQELKSSVAVMSVKFDSTVSGGKIIDENDFRTFGLIKDPQFANVIIGISGLSSSFSALETVTGSVSNASGTIVVANTTSLKLTNVTGFFSSDDIVTGATSNATANVDTVVQPTTYFDQTFKIIVDNVNGTFSEDEEVFQGTGSDKNANGNLYFANSTVLRLTDSRGALNISDDVAGVVQSVTGNTTGASAKVTGIIAKDLVDYKGEVLYIENVDAIEKNANQTETIKLIIEF